MEQIRILLTEEVYTFINALRYVYDNVNYGNKVLVSTIPNAISQGMQQLRDIAVRSNDQRVIDKYNAAIQDPYIAQFYQA
jgi:predicted transcriptional regulator